MPKITALTPEPPHHTQMQIHYYVYILTNHRNTTLYIGVTNYLERRIYEHITKQVSGFSNAYNLNKLVYFEQTESIDSAIQREKQLKGWLRKKKIALIESTNPDWRDLSLDFMETE